MNKLESTLKHNLDIAMQNAINILSDPEGYTNGQRMKAVSDFFSLREQLVFVDTFDKKPDSNLHPLFQGMMDSYKETFGIKEAEDNFNAQAVSEDEWKDQEPDVNRIKTI